MSKSVYFNIGLYNGHKPNSHPALLRRKCKKFNWGPLHLYTRNTATHKTSLLRLSLVC